MGDLGKTDVGSSTGKGKGSIAVRTAGPSDLELVLSLDEDFDISNVPILLSKVNAEELRNKLAQAIAKLGQ